MVRAMATRCFSPPLSFSPRSPTCVSYPVDISTSLASHVNTLGFYAKKGGAKFEELTGFHWVERKTSPSGKDRMES